MEPLPPAISPYQMDILRVVTAMAWSDGELEPDEVTLMLKQFAQLFAPNSEEQRSLTKELREYLAQNIPLEDTLQNLKSIEDRRLILKLSYQVIQASQRQPDEAKINLDEAAAYQNLVKLLDLPPSDVAEIEAEFTEHQSMSDVANRLFTLIGG